MRFKCSFSVPLFPACGVPMTERRVGKEEGQRSERPMSFPAITTQRRKTKKLWETNHPFGKRIRDCFLFNMRRDETFFYQAFATSHTETIKAATRRRLSPGFRFLLP